MAGSPASWLTGASSGVSGGADGLKELGGRGCDPLKEGWVGIGADRQLGQTDAQQGQQAPEDQPAPEMRL